ncbi:hypothetical protein [Thalassospira lucentensis]|nr:hypothetical protein [Thalassospira lucentensis]
MSVSLRFNGVHMKDCASDFEDIEDFAEREQGPKKKGCRVKAAF